MLNKDATVRQHFTWNILCMSSKIVGAFQLKLENNDWESVSLVLNIQNFLNFGVFFVHFITKPGNSKLISKFS